MVSLHVGRGWSRRLSTANIHHTTRRACRQSAFDVEWGVLCVFAAWSSWAGHWCVCGEGEKRERGGKDLALMVCP